jgi:hypothetical protein
VKRLATPRYGQRIGISRSRSSFKLVGGRPRSGRNPDNVRSLGGQAPVAASRSSSEFRSLPAVVNHLPRSSPTAVPTFFALRPAR